MHACTRWQEYYRVPDVDIIWAYLYQDPRGSPPPHSPPSGTSSGGGGGDGDRNNPVLASAASDLRLNLMESANRQQETCSFPANVSGRYFQCADLSLDHSATDPKSCGTNCCKDPECSTWQWSAATAAAGGAKRQHAGCWRGRCFGVDGIPDQHWVGGQRPQQFTAAGFPSANSGQASHTWIEVTHAGMDADSPSSTSGYWMYLAPGSGVFYNLGRTAVFADHLEALASLPGGYYDSFADGSSVALVTIGKLAKVRGHNRFLISD